MARLSVARAPLLRALRTLAITQTLMVVGCDSSKEVPPHLAPAPSTVVQYYEAAGRCPIVLKPYRAVGGPGGDECVNRDVFRQICRRALRCEKVERPKHKSLIGR